MGGERPSIRPGDWVRFYRNGDLLIGVVAYVRQSKGYPYGWTVCTERGSVDAESVLETRRKKPDAK